MKPRLTVFSEVQSGNLGDQALARSLFGLLSPYFEMTFAAFGNPPAAGPSVPMGTRPPLLRAASRLAAALPGHAVHRVKWHLSGPAHRYRERCAELIDGSALVLVGGGQLLKNNRGLFCDRLAEIARAARRHSVPVGLVGVGADSGMNPVAWRMAGRLLRTSRFILARDAMSQDRIVRNSRPVVTPLVVPDLAFALDHRCSRKSLGIGSRMLAVNVMSLVYFQDPGRRAGRVPFQRLREGLGELVRLARTEGFVCTLFTTDPPSDRHSAEAVRRALAAHDGLEVDVFHPPSLEALLVFLSGVDHVVAMRMHAGILAYVAGCNVVGVHWDDKVRGVWSAAGESERVIDIGQLLGRGSGAALFRRLVNLPGPSQERRETLADAVRTGVEAPVFRALTSLP